MYRKYYSYNDMPAPAFKNNENKNPPAPIHNNDKKTFGKLETDDIILAVVALMLFTNDCDDKLLLLALAFVFITSL